MPSHLAKDHDGILFYPGNNSLFPLQNQFLSFHKRVREYQVKG